VDVACTKPDWEIRRKIALRPGGPKTAYRTYAHGYWRPLIVYAFGRTIVGRKRLAKMWEGVPH
jgi:hypothetical protein